MLNHITWSSYWTTLSLSLAVYYGYVAWLNRAMLFNRRMTSPPALTESNDEMFPQAEACSRELDAYLEQASYGKPSKNEIIFGIHQVIKKFPSLPGTNYEAALGQLIGFSAKAKCGIHLSDDDIRQVWLV